MRQLKVTKSITNREAQSLEKYLQEIGKVELINPETEAYLTRQIKLGSKKALDTLVGANLRFAVSVAKQYQSQGLSLPDLINEANIGLIKAALRFDETRGFKFISYAVWWIRQSILQALAEQSRIVRIPFNKVELNSRIGKTYQHLEQELEREPTPEEIAEHLHIRFEEVSNSLNNGLRHISMDSPVLDGDDESTLIETLENANAEFADSAINYYESLKKDIERSLMSLPERQKEILLYYFGIGIEDPLTLEDIAIKLNLTKERVRQIKDRALFRLKSTKRYKLLKVYMG
ncbi:MAG TPA: RNA polymerase sigma factor RpoD/SigA [Panacibacter sp.]|nr:RNA polymerase sigma factor RpoD/SigA [Panacibacter sp.]